MAESGHKIYGNTVKLVSMEDNTLARCFFGEKKVGQSGGAALPLVGLTPAGFLAAFCPGPV